MAILGFSLAPTGTVGDVPSLISIATNDTSATVLTAGYLNELHQAGVAIKAGDLAAVRLAPTADTVASVWYQVTVSGNTYSLATI